MPYNFYDYSTFEPNQIIEYLRKSRSDDPLLTVDEVLEKHENILKEWCDKNLSGAIPIENIYREVVSGETIKDRPVFKKVLELIESPRIKAILVVEVQRLSRGDLEDAGRLIKLLRYTNTIIITPQKTYDLKDDYDRDIFERELKRGNEFLEYQKKIMGRGRLLSASQGNYVGKIAPYGYERVWVMDGKRRCPTLKIVEHEAEAVRLIFDLYVNHNMGASRIARELKKRGYTPRKSEMWTLPTINSIILNPHYTGKIFWQRKKNIPVVEDGVIRMTSHRSNFGEYPLFEGKHEAIIPYELWEAAINAKNKRTRVKISKTLSNPFAGLIYCSCGRVMKYRISKTPNGILKKYARLICNNPLYCSTRSCYYYKIVEIVKLAMEEHIEDFKVKLENQKNSDTYDHDNLIKRLESRIDELNKKEISLWDKYSEDSMPREVFLKLKDKVIAERDEVKNELVSTIENKPIEINYEEKIYQFREALDALLGDYATAEEKNNMLKQCIERIDYKREPLHWITKENPEEPGTMLRTCTNWNDTEVVLDIEFKV